MSVRILENYRVKIVVFLLAVLLWFYVVAGNQYEYDMDIPIQTANVEKGKIVANDLPEKAKVKFRGKGMSLIALALSHNVNLVLDMNNVSRRRLFRPTIEDVRLPRRLSVTVVEILSPDSVKVNLTELGRKQVRVVPVVTVRPVAGYTVVGKISVTPDSVWLSGPVEYISRIDEIQTAELAFVNVKADVKKRMPLAVSKIPQVHLQVKDVVVHADVQKLMEKALTGIPVRVMNLPPGVKALVIPPTLTLTLEGGVDQLLQVSPEQVSAYIDWEKQRSPEEKDYPAYIEVPEGIGYREVNPKRFKVVLQREEAGEKGTGF